MMPVRIGPESQGLVRLPLDLFGGEYWLVDITGRADSAALETLSSRERARAARFVFAEHRHRFELAHIALRLVLSARLGIPAAQVEFFEGPHGKPSLATDVDLAFNMSHSDALALIMIARLPRGSEIGVDIEALRPVKDARSLAAIHFTRTEQVELEACSPEEGDRLFLSGWTRKEACLKAVGSGLSIAPSTFECGLAPVRANTRIVTPAGIAHVDADSIPIGRGHVAAAAVAFTTAAA
jgi:4'-phosphopantetheinyl transferase